MSALAFTGWLLLALLVSIPVSLAVITAWVLLVTKRWRVELTVGGRTWRKSRGDWPEEG